jgi:hypothetical protein
MLTEGNDHLDSLASRITPEVEDLILIVGWDQQEAIAKR